LVELGPGKGTLMRDILRTLARAMPALHAAAQVHLVEMSAPFRATQAETLQGYTAIEPQWHDDAAHVPDGPALLVANEFLDALPVRQLVAENGSWRERLVTCDDAGALAFTLGQPLEAISAAMPAPPVADGAVLEVRRGEEALLATLARRKHPLTALFIDYGPADLAFGDTLQAMRSHAYVDPLLSPGTCDLTAHVQFAHLVQKARAAGFACDGPITQAEFLGALGLAARASRLMAANPRDAAGIELAAQRLVAPTGMGSLFKVLALRTPALPKPPPFT
jgi:SAM-dependent MidA family methyltransferase